MDIFCCNFWYQLKSLTIPEAIRHPTRETQEHGVTNAHFAPAPSAYGCSCRMCDFLGRMVLAVVREEERPRSFFEMQTHTPQAIGPAGAKTQQRRAPSTPAAAVSRGQGVCCLVLCVLRECVCVWCPTTSGTKGAGPAWRTMKGHWLPVILKDDDSLCWCGSLMSRSRDSLSFIESGEQKLGADAY